MKPLQRINAKKDWVAWLEEQRREKEPTAYEKYKKMCSEAAKEIGAKYHIEFTEAVISPNSVHVYFKQGSKLYINIIPRSLIIKTCKFTPHLERAVRLQLFRQKKKNATNSMSVAGRTDRSLP